MTNPLSTTPVISNQVKMTSIEIANMTGKKHSHVMRDIRNEIESIGDSNQSIFGLVDYVDAKGETRPCYEFGKAGAMQIALRYDAKVRYKVVQRIESLEGRIKFQKRKTISSKIDDLKATIEMANIFGLKGNQALLSANSAIKKIHNFDCMATLGITHLIAEEQTQYFTPSVLGKPLGMSAQKVNKALESLGLQAAVRDHRNKIIWEVTEAGKGYCQLLDTNKKRSNGTPVMQVKWSQSVMERVAV